MKKLFVIFAALVLCAAFAVPAPAQSKFPNKDTAKDRRDFTMGTQRNTNDITIEDAPGQDRSIQVTPPERDFDQDNRIDGPIFVYPEVNIPAR